MRAAQELAALSDLADLAPKHRASVRHDDVPSPPLVPVSAAAGSVVDLDALDAAAWQDLADRAIEPNGYYLPGWETAVNALAPGHGGARALAAWDAGRLLALLPAVPVRRAFQLPFPALASAHPYGVLGTPLLDSATPDAAADALLAHAIDEGHHALVLRDVALDGAALAAITRALARRGLSPVMLHGHVRAALDATRDADALLHDALGGRKLKELRRQRNRLADCGTITFTVAQSPDEIAAALETFFALEASGWKGQRGTALVQSAGDAAFMRRATAALSLHGACEIATLSAGTVPVASGVVLRHLDRAFWFKLGIDERFAKFSPGVQFALELTRHFCADPAIRMVDSTASPGHPMIDPIWRDRLAIGDLLVPLRRRDPVVGLLHAALLARHHSRAAARSALNFARRLTGRR